MSFTMFLHTKCKRRTLPVLIGSIDMDGTGRHRPVAAPRQAAQGHSGPMEHPRRLETIPSPAQARGLLQGIEDRM
jgi:hypothetical protein